MKKQEQQTSNAKWKQNERNQETIKKDGEKDTNVTLLLDYGLVHSARFRALLRQGYWSGRPLTLTHSRVALVEPAALFVLVAQKKFDA